MENKHPKPWKAEKISGPYRRWRLTDANGVVFLRGLDEPTAREIASKDATIARLEAEVAELKQKNEELLDHANAVNSDCEQLEAENAALRERAEGLANEVGILRLLATEVRGFIGEVDSVPQPTHILVECLRTLGISADVRRKATDAAGWLKPKEGT